MDMFQYISEIIKNISPAQRFFALITVLITILLMSLGPKIIGAFTNSDNALENKINRLELANAALNEQNRELQTIVIQSQVQCAKDITQVREEILKEIGLLERELKQTSNPFMVRQVDTYGPASGSNGMDTVVVAMKKQPEVIQVNPNTEVLTHVKKLKKQLESDLEKNK
jgi:hypothetical protein